MDILDAWVKILVPAIEKIAAAVETIQGNYADLLAKMDNVVAAVNGEPHWLLWFPTVVMAIATLGTLWFFYEQNKKQNTIRLKDKILEQMSGMLRETKINLNDMSIMKKDVSILFRYMSECLLFATYLPVLYSYYYYPVYIEWQSLEQGTFPNQVCSIYLDIKYYDMSLRFRDIAKLTPKGFVERYKKERKDFEPLKDYLANEDVPRVLKVCKEKIEEQY